MVLNHGILQDNYKTMIQKHAEIIKKIKLIPKTVLEIGSRDGRDANFYKNEFNLLDDSIYVVEPNPLMCNEIKINFPNFNIFEIAIDKTEGNKIFHQVTSGGMDPIGVSSLLDRTDDFYERHNTNKISVKSIMGSTLLDLINEEIDICKIDVEGLTYDVILSFGEKIKKIKTFHIETEHHAFWKNQKLHNDVVSLIEDLGYKLMWLDNENQQQSDSVWVRQDLYSDYVNEKLKSVEIHSLICSKDLLMGINNFDSLQKYEEFKDIPIFLHDDGSLTKSDIKILEKLKNTTIIGRDVADKEIKNFIENKPNCLNYRLGNNSIFLWHKIKLFDYFFFSRTKKILGLDTDLLFLKKPEEIINLIVENIPFYFPDNQSAYSFNEPKNEITVLDKVNTGLIYIPSEDYYNIDDIENALTNLIRNNINYFPSWIEQSAFAHMFYKNGKYVSLSPERYRIPYFQEVDVTKTECLHFVSYPPVRDLYVEYIKFLDFNKYEIIYDKDFIVDFESKKIPLNLNIKKVDNSNFLFQYTWDLENGHQKFLDHIFKISDDDYEKTFNFQSNKSGFFYFNTKSDKLTINHTYDWYSTFSWETLDIIYIRN